MFKVKKKADWWPPLLICLFDLYASDVWVYFCFGLCLCPFVACVHCVCVCNWAYGSMSFSRIGIAYSPQGARADNWCGMAGEAQQLQDGSVCVCREAC